MMVNLGVDGYTKTLNHQKILRKRKKQQHTENRNICYVGARFLHLACQGGLAPLLAVSYVSADHVGTSEWSRARTWTNQGLI